MHAWMFHKNNHNESSSQNPNLYYPQKIRSLLEKDNIMIYSCMFSDCQSFRNSSSVESCLKLNCAYFICWQLFEIISPLS